MNKTSVLTFIFIKKASIHLFNRNYTYVNKYETKRNIDVTKNKDIETIEIVPSLFIY